MTEATPASAGTGADLADSDTIPSDALVLPVGHYLGALYPDRDAPLSYHRVRVGDSVLRLFTDVEFGIWTLAHGPAVPPEPGTWTVAALAAAVREQGGGDVSAVLADLLAEGALVAIEPDTEAAIDAARGYRFRSLLAGLGPGAVDSEQFVIGLVGQPVALVDELSYEFWQWAPLHPSVWDACRAMAAVDQQVTGGSRDPEQMLTELLPRIQALLGAGAGYLDEAAS